MTWADFYLICFAVGFLFSLLSFLAGGLRWHVHLPHFSHVHVAPPQAGAGHGTAAAPLANSGNAGHGVVHHQAAHLSPFNFTSVTAFLAWFGGTGYLLTRFSGVWFVTGLSLAVVSGLVGGAIVFLFLSRVLISQEESMDPADYEMTGALGIMVRVTIPFAGFQIFMVASDEPVATMLPLGEMATDVTANRCPINLRTMPPVAAFQRIAV